MDPAEFKSEFRVLAEGRNSPQASLILPVYRPRYLEPALAAVLQQEGVTLEILISDDASGDGTPARILGRLGGYRGPHRVLFRQGRQRLGVDHFTHLAEAASCEIAVMAHHDDIALPQRASRVLETFAATGADVISSAFTLIDAGGQPLAQPPLDSPTRFIPIQQIIEQVWLPVMLGAGMAWRRRVYADFPRLTNLYLPGGYDMRVCFRGALQGGFYYLDEALFQRRNHAAQWGKRLFDRRSSLVDAEGQAARLLGAAVAMHKDIAHLQQQAAGGALNSLAELDAGVIQTILRQAVRLNEVRAELSAAGKRILWVEESRYEALIQPPLLRRLADRQPFWAIKNWLKKIIPQ